VRLAEPPAGLVLPVCPKSVSLEPRRSIASYRRPLSAARISSEGLTEVSLVSTFDIYGVRKILPPRSIFVRESVAGLLVTAQRLLPDPLGLCVLDGLRSESEQFALLSHYGEDAAREGFVAEITESGPRAPHLTGGAVDVTLELDGIPLALGSDFDEFNSSSIYPSVQTSPTVGSLKSWLAFALLSTGFAPHPNEWWHWSFGDDNWAEFHSHSHVLYDEV
jgi:D-alanyl-D-alanine dipeptidase